MAEREAEARLADIQSQQNSRNEEQNANLKVAEASARSELEGIRAQLDQSSRELQKLQSELSREKQTARTEALARERAEEVTIGKPVCARPMGHDSHRFTLTQEKKKAELETQQLRQQAQRAEEETLLHRAQIAQNERQFLRTDKKNKQVQNSTHRIV